MPSSSQDRPSRWCHGRAASFYTELEHPADLFLEIKGRDPAELLEHALFALFDQIVDLRTVRLVRRRTFSVREADLTLALRHTLTEALALFNLEGFLAAAAGVRWEGGEGTVGVVVTLWGENVDRSRHELQTEIKAVTYHRLLTEQTEPGAWRATILFDV
ncbi:MAG: archease [Gaiellales bacterium]|nr:archease [Gaiellales bacterium]